MLVRNFLVVSLSLCMVVQSAWAQGASPASGKPSAPSATPPRPGSGSPGTPDYSKGAVWWPKFTRVYRSPYIAEVNMANSDRLERLLRDGNLYLSLEDAMALALENNLDIAFMRYEPLISDADILRAKAGSFIRSGLVAGATTSSQSTGASAATTGISTGASSGGGLPFVSTSTIGGPAIPQLDPVVQANYQWIHQSFPQTSNFITGTNTLIQTQATNNVTFAKSFLTGTALSLALNNRAGNSNNIRNIFNPALNSSATLNFQQSLTQGFGRSVNSRNRPGGGRGGQPAARPDRRSDQREAAGDDPTQRPDQVGCCQPDGCRGPRHYHHSHYGAPGGTDRADPGPDEHGAAGAARAGAVAHPADQR
ncbi:MAG: hypothetical protein HY236_02215 [Acidobacteria bacterium]|nr:hypothetical protein [Acidobacteriota bacterium]